MEGDIKTGFYKEEIKFENNMSCFKEYINFVLRREYWYENWKLHREDDLPALIEYYENGNLRIQKWMKNGEPYLRENDLQSIVRYYESGQLEIEEWKKGFFHQRKGGKPSIIAYFENGNKKWESWNQIPNLKLLDENGDIAPAYIYYDINGNIVSKRWFSDYNDEIQTEN